MIRAILRAQLLSMRGLGLTKNPGAWLSAIPVIVFYFFWVSIAFIAYLVCSSFTDLGVLLQWLSGGLLVVCIYWQAAPVITASMGASLDLQKLIVYPIPLDRLFAVEVMLRFLTVGEMLVVLAGAALGLLRNPVAGGWWAVPRILIAWLVFIVFNLLLAAGIRSLIERLLRHPRIREAGMLVFVLLCALPSAIAVLHVPLERAVPYLPLQMVFPWGAAAQMATPAGGAMLIAAFLILAVWTVAAYGFGRRQFYRALRLDPFAGRQPTAAKKASPAWIEAFFRLPGRLWTDPLAAMVEKELRTLSRCSGFRLVYIMGFTFSLILFVPPLFAKKGAPTFLMGHVVAGIGVYSLLLTGFYTFWNSFGYDRSAAQFYFASPVPFRRVIAAKNIAAAFSQTTQIVIISVIYLALPIPFEWWQLPEAFAVSAVSCLYLFALGNMTSVRFPTPLDPDKMDRGAASRSKNALTTLVLPFAFLPITLAYWGRSVFHSGLIFYLLLLVAGIIGGIVYWIATDSAVDVTLTGREKMIAALSKGSGPLSAS